MIYLLELTLTKIKDILCYLDPLDDEANVLPASEYKSLSLFANEQSYKSTGLFFLFSRTTRNRSRCLIKLDQFVSTNSWRF